MFGWINDCCESLIISKFGREKWHEIKEKAGCTVQDGGFIRHQYYTDQSSVDLVMAISQVLDMPVNTVLEVFGQYFMEFTRYAGYDNLLNCQGSNLRLWLSNLNALHEHLQDTLPRGKFPEFWCKDDTEIEGCILLYYFSERGSLFVPFVVGLVKEIARYHFDLEITMEVVQTQGETEDAKYTIYRIGTVDKSQMYKLTAGGQSSCRRDSIGALKEWETIEDMLRDADIKEVAESSGCPFHQMQKVASDQKIADHAARKFWDRVDSSAINGFEQSIGEHKVLDTTPPIESSSAVAGNVGRDPETITNALEVTNEVLISNQKMKEIFPYHVVIDENFIILQIGGCTSRLIGSSSDKLIGAHVKNVFKIKRPMLADWEWDAIFRFQEQTFFLQPNLGEKSDIKLKAHYLNLSDEPRRALFVLAPDAKNIPQLSNMNLTMSDLPLHTFQRDAIFLGEHMYSGIRSAHKLDKISRKLAYEHNLSNSLLYSMLPQEVAKTLRNGDPYEPQHHENVTLFFSDVVGFTDLCAQLPPWDVVDMLNRLYTVMDFLADRFRLYKVETIGDAYMCCSGLPDENEFHAEDVANFAIAVRECVSLVKSPLTNEAIRVRIGLHSGNCMSGVVGTMTPRYCLFGDMVNTTSRHESTGEPDKIQCSTVTHDRLTHFTTHPEYYIFTPRGFVDMKGKGKMYTYWLDGAGENNPTVGHSKLQALRHEVQEMLDSKTWRKRRYFERRSTNSSFSSQVLATVRHELTEADDENSSCSRIEINRSSPLNEGNESSILKLQFYRQPTDSLRYTVVDDDDDFSQQIRRESFKQNDDGDCVTTPISHSTTDESKVYPRQQISAHDFRHDKPTICVPLNSITGSVKYEKQGASLRNTGRNLLRDSQSRSQSFSSNPRNTSSNRPKRYSADTRKVKARYTTTDRSKSPGSMNMVQVQARKTSHDAVFERLFRNGTKASIGKRVPPKVHLNDRNQN